MSSISILSGRCTLFSGLLVAALSACCLPQDSPPTLAGVPDNPPTKRSARAPKIVVPPRPISIVTPKYPKEAKKKKIEGPVVLGATVTLDGNLNDLTVVSGNPILADAALEAVRQWRYQPSKINGEPVEAQHEIVITFKKDKDDKDGGAVYLGPDDLSPVVPLEPPPDIQQRLAAGEFFAGNSRELTHPQGTYMPDPEYSETARRAKYQCTNVLSMIVGADGQPLSVWVVKPCGEGLDEKSIAAIQKWTFRPATKDGEPVPVFINVETSFHLY
jgi:TonB family protein